MRTILEHKNDSIKANGTNKFDEYRKLIGKGYLVSNLDYYIQNNAAHIRKNSGPRGWTVESDRDTNLNNQLLHYLVRCYTLKEVYTIFYKDQEFTDMNACQIKEAKQLAYLNIDDEDSFSWEEQKRLRRRVMGMSPIQFGLLVDLVWESELFWDTEKKKEVYPVLG